ncbi:SET domain-containing protein [Actibacterium pelagium]|uniref:SET domain-containing protein-lysine N-methyltransferase n=1 Tax=Actibacterium pelagium TaxID=2029103 RepID=A0A917ANQ6_9RHOB|nr:SET domain-containing protein-lysine N-methyltransferase [Actibacterium pelagium]GGE60491.1 SET domain-containing protein-lysine N-methyltransferase [Actibacterium pelagium]
MLTVETFVGPSAIEGVGVFAAKDIEKGTVIWRFDRRFDRLVHRADIARSDYILQNYLDKYAYPYHENTDLLVIEIDNGRFMNHAEYPNVTFAGHIRGVALFDIEEGEEITCNYADFEPGFALMPSALTRSAMVRPTQGLRPA